MRGGSLKNLEKEIECLRKKMLETSKDNSLSEGETLKISQRLDKLIVKHLKKKKQNK